MNRYITRGIAEDVLGGKDVIVFGRSRESSEIFSAVAEALYDDTDRRSRINGQEWLNLTDGGSLHRAHDASDLRGKRADVVYLPYQYGSDQDILTESLLTVTANKGEVIRA